jgi:GH15 family glucan-1,4-alpha-glucosidase
VSTTPIADHALLSDCHGAAWDGAGSVEWWCAPRFDSPPLFARLLDDRAGHFIVRPTGGVRVERRYFDGTLVLVTVFDAPSGSVELTDGLAMAEAPRALLRRAAVHRLRPQLGEFDDLERRFQIGLADAAAASWRRPDQGIWEVRGDPRQTCIRS